MYSLLSCDGSLNRQDPRTLDTALSLIGVTDNVPILSETEVSPATGVDNVLVSTRVINRTPSIVTFPTSPAIVAYPVVPDANP